MADPVYFGFNLPFVSSAGILPLQADERLIKNDLMSLLQTSPGQRIMKPSFGTLINEFLFENMTDADLATLRSNIVSAIQTHEPRVILTSVEVVESDQANQLNIKIQGTTTLNKNKLFEIELGLNLTGGQLEQRYGR